MTAGEISLTAGHAKWKLTVPGAATEQKTLAGRAQKETDQ